MKRLVLALTLLLGACATATPQPASLTAMMQMQMREQAGIYSDWHVEGNAHQAQYDRLVRWVEQNDIVVSMAKLEKRELRGSTQLGYKGWVILLHHSLSVDAKLWTLLHELAHLFGPEGRTEQEREVIAELTAAMVCERLGLNVWPQSTGYLNYRVPIHEVQTWTVQRTGREIDRLVDALTAIARD